MPAALAYRSLFRGWFGASSGRMLTERGLPDWATRPDGGLGT